MNKEQRLLDTLSKIQNTADQTMSSISATLPTLASDLSFLLTSTIRELASHATLESVTTATHLAKLLDIDTKHTFSPIKNFYDFLKYTRPSELPKDTTYPIFEVVENANQIDYSITNKAPSNYPDFEYRLVFIFRKWANGCAYDGAYWDFRQPFTPDWYRIRLTISKYHSKEYLNLYLADIVGMHSEYLTRTTQDALTELNVRLLDLVDTQSIRFNLTDANRFTSEEGLFDVENSSTPELKSYRYYNCFIKLLSAEPIDFNYVIDWYLKDAETKSLEVFTINDVEGKIISVRYKEHAESTEFRRLFFHVKDGSIMLLPVKRLQVSENGLPNLNVFQLDYILEELAKIT